jgi:co-chaperonin GroES (HSP10)
MTSAEKMQMDQAAQAAEQQNPASRRLFARKPRPTEIDRIQGALEPAGFRILVRIPNLPEQMKKNALIMPEETRRLEEFAQLTGQVIALGPLAYRDRKRFGWRRRPWCKPGDFVMMRAYSGTRFCMRDDQGRDVIYALINDDTVQGVVRGDYEDIERV